MCHCRVNVSDLCQKFMALFTAPAASSFSKNYVVIYIKNHPLRVSQKLRDPLNGNFWDLVAEHSTVVVAKYMRRESGNRLTGDCLHCSYNSFPHPAITAKGGGGAPIRVVNR